MLTYYPHGAKLGECWITANVVISIGEPCRMNVWRPVRDHIEQCPTIRDVLPLMVGSEIIREVVDLQPEQAGELTIGFDWEQSSRLPIIQCIYRWSRDPQRRTVAYQFDGRGHREKNLTSADESRVLDAISSRGWAPVQVGGGMPLADCAKTLASAAIFVGVDSGISHVAKAVGTPVWLFKNNLHPWFLRIAHGNRHHTLSADADAFVRDFPPFGSDTQHLEAP